MTRKLTPDQLDEIEAAARAEITARVTPGSPDQLGRVRREFDAFLKVATPINVLALIHDLREADAKVERVREVHRRIPIYEMCDEGGCENAHCFETAAGDYAHDDDLVGHVCYGCSDLSDEEPIYWTCDTIKALGEEAN